MNDNSRPEDNGVVRVRSGPGQEEQSGSGWAGGRPSCCDSSISCYSNFTVKVWDASSGQETLTLKGHTNDFVLNVAFSPDGQRVVSGSDDNIKVWDASKSATKPTVEQ